MVNVGMSIGKAMKSDTVLILSVVFGFLLSLGGVTHNAFGHSVSLGSGLSYLIIALIDIGGFILGKIFVSVISGMFSGTVLYTVATVGSGIIIYTLTSYVWFTVLYAHLRKGGKKAVKKAISRKANS